MAQRRRSSSKGSRSAAKTPSRAKATVRRDAGDAPRRGRPPISPDVQRARLLDAARKALRKTYYGNVRISDVVRSAGMSSRTFYEHFASKEDVLIELMRQAGQDLVAEIDSIMSVSPAEERIERFLNAYLRACTSVPLDIDSLGDGLTSRVQQTLREGVRDVALQVAAALARVWDASATRSAPEPAAIEVVLLGLLGIASRYVHEKRVGELAMIRPALRSLLTQVWT